MNIFQDTTAWAKTTAGTFTRALLLILLHFFLCYFIINSPNGVSSFSVFFVGAFLPAMYIYAIHKLLKKIQ